MKEKGKLRSEGKNYIVQDGDIINLVFRIDQASLGRL
ncbi:MAG: DUF933 domain-containing protein [Candidatus Phytoplasma australasiaticum]|nr:DUF933 domain-containing protein [Candidatus Phytoplasma australasiaticum]